MVKRNSFKYFIAYNDHDYIGPLYITLPQMTGCFKCFDDNKTLPFKVIENNLSKNYIEIWERARSLIGKEIDSEPVYGDNDKYRTTKIKMYEDKVNTNFQSKEVPNENASYKCLSLIIIIDSVIRVNKKYYLQTLLEECKYKIKNNKVKNLINNDLESDNESDSD